MLSHESHGWLVLSEVYLGQDESAKTTDRAPFIILCENVERCANRFNVLGWKSPEDNDVHSSLQCHSYRQHFAKINCN